MFCSFKLKKAFTLLGYNVKYDFIKFRWMSITFLIRLYSKVCLVQFNFIPIRAGEPERGAMEPANFGGAGAGATKILLAPAPLMVDRINFIE